MLIAAFNTDPTLISIAERHHAWHQTGGAHGHPGRSVPQGQPGSGIEFLTFHRDLMFEFFAWNNIHHAATPASIAAWQAMPPEVQVSQTGWPNYLGPNSLPTAIAQIEANPGNIATADALGIMIEVQVHNWIHGAVAAAPGFALSATEKDVIAHTHSVESTYFYKIHGLVQHWWDQWKSHHLKWALKDAVKENVKDFILDGKFRVKELIKEHPDKFVKELIKDGFKEGIKEHKENKEAAIEEPFNSLDERILVMLTELHGRLAALEQGVQRGRAFIEPAERPAVAPAPARTRKQK